MKAAPYNPETLNHIRSGSTARALGWDEQFYLSVCRRHGIEPRHTPTITVLPEIQPTPKLQPLPEPKPAPQAAPLRPADGPCIFDPRDRELRRGDHRVVLPRRQAEVFKLICKASPEHPANGRAMCIRLGMDHLSGVGGHVMALRERIAPLNLKINVRIARTESGYWIADLRSNEPLTVALIGASFS